jgi:hypothetical protein
MALDKLARRLGMSFRFGLPHELRDLLFRFRSIEKAREAGGEFQAGINALTGTRRGRMVEFFDIQWVTVVYFHSHRGSWGWWDNPHEHRSTHVRSAVAVEIGPPVQPVLIRPERMVDKALALVGYEDIDFDALPEFSSKFYVNSPDPAFARQLVTPAVARFFLDRVRCTVDFVGPWLLMHDDCKLSAARVEEIIEQATELAELVAREQRAGA